MSKERDYTLGQASRGGGGGQDALSHAPLESRTKSRACDIPCPAVPSCSVLKDDGIDVQVLEACF